MTRQRGVAIVLALAVVALAALAATAMLVSQSTWSRQVELTASLVVDKRPSLYDADCLATEAGHQWPPHPGPEPARGHERVAQQP